MVRRARAGGIDRQIHRRGGAEGYPGRKLVQTRPPDCRLLKRHASEGDVESDAGRLGKAGQGGIQSGNLGRERIVLSLTGEVFAVFAESASDTDVVTAR
jgi:hypothetical protein